MSDWTNRATLEALAEMEVEDRAIRHLGSLPHKMAEVTAIKAALDLAANFEIEAREMLRRNDPRPVYKSTEDARSWLRSVTAMYHQDPLWHAPVDPKYRNLFADLYSDAAAFVAYNVARYVLFWAESK